MGTLFENEHRGDFKLYEDWVFRYLYSKDDEENRQALIAVLNVVLNRKDDPIVGIEIKNPFFLRDSEDGKESVLDIFASTTSGETIDIEMQNKVVKFYGNRTLFYGSRMVNSALEKGQEYDMMEKSIVISFVNGILFPNSSRIHTLFQMREEKEHFLLTDRMEIHFIEMKKIDPECPVEELDSVGKLAAYMLYAGDKTKEDYVQKLIETGGDAVTMTEKVYRKLTDDEIARAYRDSIDKAERDRISLMKYEIKEASEAARKAGWEEGIEKGIAKGIEQGLCQGMCALIGDNIEEGKSEVQILEKLQRRFQLTEEQAKHYFDRFRG